MEFREDINGLRAVAVVAVLLYHFALPGFDGGFAGVDIFFVISGFLMTGILLGRLEGGLGSVATFYLARARRIVPALVVLCAAVLVLGWFWVAPLHYGRLAGHAAGSVAFISNLLYWKQINYFNPDASTFWLLHTWSLSVEWQFYLVYPLALLALRRLFGITDARHLRLVLIVATAASFLAALLAARYAPRGAFYLLPPRAWELLAGGLVWVFQDRLRAGAAARRALVWIGLVVIALSIVRLDHASPWATVLVVFPVAGTVLVLLGNQPSPVLGNGVFQALGRWSYSIYLWHWPLSVFLREWRPDAGPVLVAAAIGASVLLGWLSYRFVETPMREGLRRVRPWTQWATQAVAAAVVAGLAIEVVSAGGHRERLPIANVELYQRYSAERQHVAFPLQCSVHDGARRDPACDIGTPGAPHVLVVGDSHAQQWYGWWMDYAQSRPVHVEFYTLEGCDVTYDALARPNCVEFWKSAEDYIRASSAQAVVVNSNWQVPAQLVERHPPRELLRLRLPSLFAAARRDGRPTLVTAALPTVRYSHSDEITAHLFRDSPVDGLARADCADFARRAAGLNADLRELADSAGVIVVDPASTMCHAGLVPVISEDRHLMFRDGNHVSTIAARRWGGSLFAPFIESLQRP